MTAPTSFQQRRRGDSFRGCYYDSNNDWSDEERGAASADPYPVRRSPALSKFGGFLLPPQSSEEAARHRLTVVFDLDETLVYGRKGPLYVRPGIDELFNFLSSQDVEVVVWTSSQHHYADAVVSHIDAPNCVAHVIYRHHIWCNNVAMVDDQGKKRHSLKNLNLLGRNLDNVLIVENTPDCLLGFEENGLLVEDYDGGELEDFTLFAIIDILRDLLKARADDPSGSVSVPEYIQRSDRLQLRELPTDKGATTRCYCLPSHSDFQDRYLQFPAASLTAQKVRSPLLSSSSGANSKQHRRAHERSKDCSPYHAILMKREIMEAKRRYESRKIPTH